MERLARLARTAAVPGSDRGPGVGRGHRPGAPMAVRAVTRPRGFAAAMLAAALLAAGCGTAKRPADGDSGDGHQHPARSRGERPPAGKPSEHPRPGDLNGDG